MLPQVPSQPVEQAVDGGGQRRLGNHVDDRHAKRLRHPPGAAHQAARRRAHQRQRRRVLQAGQLLDQLHTVHAGHQQVAEDQVIVVLLQAAHRLRPVMRAVQMGHPVLAEQVEQVLALERLAFDDQHPIGQGCHRTLSAHAGRLRCTASPRRSAKTRRSALPPGRLGSLVVEKGSCVCCRGDVRFMGRLCRPQPPATIRRI